VIDLGYVLRRAWVLFRSQRILWTFGFMASLGTIGVRLGVGNRGVWDQMLGQVAPELQRRVSYLFGSAHRVGLLAGLGLVVVPVSFGLALLNAAGRAALVDQVRGAEEQGRVVFRSGWEAGKRHLWTVLLLRVVLGLPSLLVTLVGLFPTLAWSWIAQGDVFPAGRLIVPLALLACLVPSICTAILLSVPLNTLLRLAVRASVLQGCGWRASIGQAWAMGRRNTGTVAILWLIQFCVMAGTFVFLGVPLVLLALVLLSAATVVSFVSAVLAVVLMAAAGAGISLLAAAVGGLAESYVSAVWTLAYRELLGLGLTGAEPELA
jgi:hypothetical protein